MSSITFDTLKYVKQLETAGIPAVQAEAFVNAQRDIVAEALDTSLATKADVLRLENRIALLDAKLDSKMDLLRNENAHTRWMLGALIALAVGNFAKQYF